MSSFDVFDRFHCKWTVPRRLLLYICVKILPNWLYKQRVYSPRNNFNQGRVTLFKVERCCRYAPWTGLAKANSIRRESPCEIWIKGEHSLRAAQIGAHLLGELFVVCGRKCVFCVLDVVAIPVAQCYSRQLCQGPESQWHSAPSNAACLCWIGVDLESLGE